MRGRCQLDLDVGVEHGGMMDVDRHELGQRFREDRMACTAPLVSVCENSNLAMGDDANQRALLRGSEPEVRVEVRAKSVAPHERE